MTTVVEALGAAATDRYNAFTAVHEEAASATSRPGPLQGVPVAVKDLIDHAGQTTTAGSAFYRHHASRTASSVARLEEAGAVVVGRTNLHEFAFGFSSENPWFGPVLNPRDTRLSAGGSSGGSAAAVAAGIVPLALGTDTGGSVRVPAALCEVVGLKVTYDLIPTDGVFPLVPSLDTVGAIAESLELVEIATTAMAGPRWPAASPPVRRLVVPEEWVETAPASREVRESFSDFLDGAVEAGLTVEREPLPELQPSPLHTVSIAEEVTGVHGEWRRSGKPYGDDVAARIDTAMSQSQDAAALEDARRWRATVVTAMERAVAPDSFVVTPTVAAMDKVIGDDQIGGVHYRQALSWFTALVNATGHPALSVPMTGTGRRCSVQAIGPRHSEPGLLALGRRLRAAHLTAG